MRHIIFITKRNKHIPSQNSEEDAHHAKRYCRCLLPGVRESITFFEPGQGRMIKFSIWGIKCKRFCISREVFSENRNQNSLYSREGGSYFNFYLACARSWFPAMYILDKKVNIKRRYILQAVNIWADYRLRLEISAGREVEFPKPHNEWSGKSP